MWRVTVAVELGQASGAICTVECLRQGSRADSCDHARVRVGDDLTDNNRGCVLRGVAWTVSCLLDDGMSRIIKATNTQSPRQVAQNTQHSNRPEVNGSDGAPAFAEEQQLQAST